MANFTESQVQGMLRQLNDELGPVIATHELAMLELEDLHRKGCPLERADGSCIGCSVTKDGKDCPVLDWQKRHPEYANDELTMKIKVLEAGGEEAYKEKLKRQEEAKRKSEEEKQKKLDFDTLKGKLSEILDGYFIGKKYASEAGPLADIAELIGYEYDNKC